MPSRDTFDGNQDARDDCVSAHFGVPSVGCTSSADCRRHDWRIDVCGQETCQLQIFLKFLH